MVLVNMKLDVSLGKGLLFKVLIISHGTAKTK